MSLVRWKTTEQFQEDIGDQGLQGVDFVGLSAASERPLHSQCAFEPLEEDLDTPAGAIQSGQIEAVGQEVIDVSGIQGFQHNKETAALAIVCLSVLLTRRVCHS